MDPGDDARVSVGLLARHDPDAGRVVVDPTPAPTVAQPFAHDVLVALGRAVNRLDAEGLKPAKAAWHAVAAWMMADRIGDLTVLRAHRLSAAVWIRLLDVSQGAGCQLTLVCHTPLIPPVLSRILAGVEHEILTELPPAPTVPRDAGAHSRQTLGPSRTPDADMDVDLPHSPTAGVAHFRAEAFRRLTGAAFDRVDAAYTHGLNNACDWLNTHPCPGADDPGPAQWLLTRLVYDSPGRRNTLARLRGAQAGFLAHGLLLEIPPADNILTVLAGPGLTATQVTNRIVEQIRAGVAHPMVAAAVATALFTGLDPEAMLYSHLSPPADALRVHWRSKPVARSQISRIASSATFHVPTAARPLMRAAHHFARQHLPSLGPRLFAPPTVTNRRIRAAADNCQIRLPPPPPTPLTTWQIRVACTPLDGPRLHPQPGTDPDRERLSRGPYPAAPADRRDERTSYGRRTLTVNTATGVLHLVHHHLTANADSPRSPHECARGWLLIRRQLARYPRDPAGDLVGTLMPHPDVLFALRLADHPAEVDDMPERLYVRHEDQ